MAMYADPLGSGGGPGVEEKKRQLIRKLMAGGGPGRARSFGAAGRRGSPMMGSFRGGGLRGGFAGANSGGAFSPSVGGPGLEIAQLIAALSPPAAAPTNPFADGPAQGVGFEPGAPPPAPTGYFTSSPGNDFMRFNDPFALPQVTRLGRYGAF